MGTGAQRIGRSRAELWMWPLGAGTGAFVAALVVATIRPGARAPLARFLWPGDASATSTLLQTVATAAITALTLTFSLTVVALQLASQQFSPRLLRNFARDRVTKGVLAVFVAAFVFSLTALRDLRSDDAVPVVSAAVALLLGLGVVGAVLLFITHLARELRVDTMMLVVHDEARDTIEAHYPEYDDPRPRPGAELELPSDHLLVTATRGGFVERVHVRRLVARARDLDVVGVVLPRPGDHVTEGSPLALAAARRPGAVVDEEAVREAFAAAVEVGYERTTSQDVAFGFRQLTDIAVKALSPGINDPATAAHAIGHAGQLLVQLTGKRLGATLHEDADGVGRVVVRDRDLRYYLDLVCGQIRRYGEREPTVLAALLRMLRDVAVHARDDGQRQEIRRQADLIVGEVPERMSDTDVAHVHDLARRVEQALTGEVEAAYEDRSGETRSM